jgi:hypothetical protein
LDWGANKGYNKETLSKLATEHPDFYKMATSYRETEKLLHAATGADKIVMPKDTADFTQLAPVLDKLGAPQKAADYKLEVPQGVDGAFALNASEKFAELKLLPHQAKGLNEWWNNQSSEIIKQQATKEADDGRASAAKLEAEWGADTAHNSKIAGAGFRKLAADIGMDANRMAEIEAGHSVKLSAYEFAKLTKAYGEIAKVGGDKFEGDNAGGGSNNGTHTPESAKAEIKRLTADPAFAAKIFKKDAEAKKQLDDLYKVAGNGGVTTVA